ncbi:uncharacterized protein LMH87_008515 [Akanthomyces muscarius]|uniref:Uncharacterized protein n=1 Tax=Akanthomyces muscarius TaxID=2231603 RepID=A0A9W8QJC3_AKAMU|nr:uncharacterized protein LMH87_008515 [Akanthomyces muscarius]KAJ4157967.1 hypothetical protein LMH87_008515 [Akanthomyces muscarius]
MTVCPKSSAAADSGFWFGTPLFSPDGFASRWEIGDASGGVLASDRVGEPKHYRAQAGKPLRCAERETKSDVRDRPSKPNAQQVMLALRVEFTSLP